MSLAPKNNFITKANWQPSATIENLRIRARILHQLREFFAKRDILEVETPLLGHTSVTDPYIQSIPAFVHSAHNPYYLQTSPEYAMKRLLAAGSGSIYQISKAFRKEELGRWHNPEFTLVEWYRLDFDHLNLMAEVDELLQLILKTPPAEKKTYGELFEAYLQINPFHASLQELKNCAHHQAIQVASEITERDAWLTLLMSHCIEPHLGKHSPCFIYDFPASQAALARIQAGNPALASRFEVYVQGIELANGFHELQDAKEQQQRFEENLKIREAIGLPGLPIDEYFLSALSHGLPDCAGVALGIDRLIMLATHSDHLAKVLSFDFSRA